MALSAVVDLQFIGNTDGTSFTSGSATPTSGSLYIVFTVGRTGDVAARVPTLTGTNGWNTTWTRVAAATAIYRFSAIDRCGTDVFWGIAASGTAGTLTANYSAGTNLWNTTIHVIRIAGGPDTSVPIGVTGSAHDDTGGVSSVSATLTGTPAVTSIVLACGSGDHTSGSMTAGTNYALLGSTQVTTGGAGISQPEYDEAPTSTTVGITFPSADICAISAVEVLIAGVAGVAVDNPARRMSPNVTPRRW